MWASGPPCDNRAVPLPHGPSHPAARREARETWPLLAFVGVVIVFGYVEALRADDTLRRLFAWCRSPC